MSISIFNPEHYHDPTAYLALTHIEREERKRRYRPLVYICSPYSGDVELNTENARRYSRYAVDHGAIPIAPHLLFPQFMAEDKERELALCMDMVVLTRCKEIWVFGEKRTKGMRAEIRKANKRHMRIRYFTEDLKEASR